MSQNERVLSCLIEHRGSLVSKPILCREGKTLNLNARISELRDMGHKIISHVDVLKNKQKRSYYKLV